MRAEDSAPRRPVVISTWRHGQPANAAAWQILRTSGRALDAVEAAARVTEADPIGRSVGIGGRPDRDGIVTLDASIMGTATLRSASALASTASSSAS